jgi:hypothetical protein
MATPEKLQSATFDSNAKYCLIFKLFQWLVRGKVGQWQWMLLVPTCTDKKNQFTVYSFNPASKGPER